MNSRASRVLGLAACLLSSLLLTGCFDLEQTLVLEKDLSGQAGFRLKVDFEPAMLMMLRMQRSMDGKEGEPTAAEIREAREQALASAREETVRFDPEQQRAELAQGLPPGVRLLDTRFEDKEVEMLTAFTLGFDDVQKLKQVRTAPAKPQGSMPSAPPQENPLDAPFAGLVVEETGDIVLLTSKVRNPVEEQKQEMGGEGLTPDMQKELERAFEGMRIAWKIKAPFKVLEHNATRRDGDTLVWEYTLDSMKKMDPKRAAEGIRVKYKKS